MQVSVSLRSAASGDNSNPRTGPGALEETFQRASLRTGRVWNIVASSHIFSTTNFTPENSFQTPILMRTVVEASEHFESNNSM